MSTVRASITTRFNLLFILFIGALFAIVAMPQAQANPINYPGSMCVRWSGSTNVVYNSSAIGNGSTTDPLRVDCPALNTRVNNGIHSGWVRAFDQHFSQNVTCSLNSAYANSSGGMWGWWGAAQSTSGSGPGAQQMNFGTSGSNSIAHYYYSCSIPPRYSGHTSYIGTYRVREQ